jgi:O-antigen ligase
LAPASRSSWLILIGAILKFAVTWTPKNIDLQTMGVILMIGGGIGLIVSVLVMMNRRRTRMSAEVYEQRRYIEPPP